MYKSLYGQKFAFLLEKYCLDKFACKKQDQYTKSIVFLHNSNEKSEEDILKTAFIIKYLGLNLTKEVQDLHCSLTSTKHY